MSGMRVTGTLHIGHWLGVLSNWVRLQEEHDCFFALADWHMLTTGAADTSKIRENTRGMLLDWLAVGVDPEKATVYVQSAVPEIAELALLLGMITPVPWLQRNPTVKEQIQDLHLDEERVGYGLLGYPVLQAADILVMLGQSVPVGRDQLPHLELSRDIARRFNALYAPLFPEPEGLLTETPLVVGLDGRKMSKSYGNDIRLGASAEDIASKVMAAITDPARQRRHDPGHPEVCTIYALWHLFKSPGVERVAYDCRLGTLGCVDDKRQLASSIEELIAPIRERREKFARDPERLDAILANGNARARKAAMATMEQVRSAMRLNDFSAASPALPA